MLWHWELIIGCTTIILMTLMEAASKETNIGKKLVWIKGNFHLIISFMLIALAIIFTSTILLAKTYATTDKNIPVPSILKLLQFFTWNDVYSFLENNFLAVFCIFAIPMIFFKELGLWKSIQIALLCTSIAYFIPVMIENYWFFIHDLMGFRDFWDLYANGPPEWFFDRIISAIAIFIAFFIFRVQLPRKERLFHFQFKRKCHIKTSLQKL